MNAITSQDFLIANNVQHVSERVMSPSKAAAAVEETANSHRFADCMETAMTGTVMTGTVLFAAGLLNIVVPACTPLTDADLGLYALAGLSAGATLFMALRGIFGK